MWHLLNYLYGPDGFISFVGIVVGLVGIFLAIKALKEAKIATTLTKQSVEDARKFYEEEHKKSITCTINKFILGGTNKYFNVNILSGFYHVFTIFNTGNVRVNISSIYYKSDMKLDFKGETQLTKAYEVQYRNKCSKTLDSGESLEIYLPGFDIHDQYYEDGYLYLNKFEVLDELRDPINFEKCGYDKILFVETYSDIEKRIYLKKPEFYYKDRIQSFGKPIYEVTYKGKFYCLTKYHDYWNKKILKIYKNHP